MTEPISDAEFGALMVALGPFEKQPKLAVAVSGGPDSLALTLLGSRWAKSLGGRVIGLTVDHDLRACSAEEADQTGRWLKSYGIDHHVLKWEGEKPSTGLPKQARQARYDRLQRWCSQVGILHLLVAHHKQDQAETVALRLTRKSGPDGLAGMAAIREFQDLRLLRPLLGINKKRLTATLDRMGQHWIDDPSNRNLAFTRNRIRHKGLDIQALYRQAVDRGRRRRTRDHEIQAALVRIVKIDPAGFATVAPDQLSDLPDDVLESLMSRALMTIGGCVYPPGTIGLQRLLDVMRNNRSFHGKTLSHCRIVSRKSDWLLCCEQAFPSSSILVPNQWQHWDSRFLIRYQGRQKNLTISHLGKNGWPPRNKLNKQDKWRSIPFEARASLPSVWQEGDLVAVPHISFFKGRLDPSVLNLVFRPKLPLAKAPFAAHM